MMVEVRQTVAFPAPAGMNRNATPAVLAANGVPRASGDEPLIIADLDQHRERSPRQRG